MKLRLIIPFISLLIMAVCSQACSSNDDIMDNQISDLNLQNETPEEMTAIDTTSSNVVKISFSETGNTIYEIPIKMMSEEEFRKASKGKIYKNEINSGAKSPSETVSITPNGNWYNVRLNNGILEVYYSTTSPSEFPLDERAYGMHYNCKPDEHPGEARGHASLYKLGAELDIVKKIGEYEYTYSHTAYLNATIDRMTGKIDVQNPK